MGAKGKPLIVPPFGKKDIEKIAAQVLEEYGDDVINKAIEEGKIIIPGGNIDVASLPQVDFNNLTLEDFNAIKGKAFYTGEMVFYPNDISGDDDIYYIGFYLTDDRDSAEFMVAEIYLVDDVPFVNITHYPIKDFGTTLYQHNATINYNVSGGANTTGLLSFYSNDKRSLANISFTNINVIGSWIIGGSNNYYGLVQSLSIRPQGNILLKDISENSITVTSITTDTVTEL